MVSFFQESIEPDEIVDFLGKNGQLKEICQKVLHQKIVKQAAQARNLIIEAEEIQEQAERLRRQKHLEKATDALAWLKDQLITADIWEAGIRDCLMAKKLAESIFSKEVEKFFAQNRLDFEQLLLYQIIVPYEQLALEIFYQIEEEEMSFYQAAHIYDIDERRRHQCGYEGKLYRWGLKPNIAAVVFSARPREIIRPIKSDQGHHLLMVEEFIPAELTPETYQSIIDRMFNEWLTSELNYLLHNARENTQPTAKDH